MLTNRLLLIFEKNPPQSLVFKEGMDFLLLAASLDWEVTVVFMKDIYEQLKNELALLAEYDVMNIEVWAEKKTVGHYKIVIQF